MKSFKVVLLAQALSAIRILASSLVPGRTIEYRNGTTCTEEPPLLSLNKTSSRHELERVEELIYGRVPDTSIPTNISSEGIKSLQLLAYSKLVEISFFTSLILNVSSNQPGFEIDDFEGKLQLLEGLNTIIAVGLRYLAPLYANKTQQEKLHYLTISKALLASGSSPIQPCQYIFPVTCLSEAIQLARKLTDLMLGTLQDIIEIFSRNGDHTITRITAAILGQEGKQVAWYRGLQQGKRMSALEPFLTPSSREMAFSVLQRFTTANSCPTAVNFSSNPSLEVISRTISRKDQYLDFEMRIESLHPVGWPRTGNTEQELFTQQWLRDNNESLSIVYVNQQHRPIVEVMQDYDVRNTTISFRALFPFSSYLLYGLSLASVVVGSNALDDIQQVSNATLFGPALIQVV